MSDNLRFGYESEENFIILTVYDGEDILSDIEITKEYAIELRDFINKWLGE